MGKSELHEEAVRSCARDADTEYIKVTSHRPNQWGSQNSTVVVHSELAKQMIKLGFIKIGWTPCRVRARIDIARCYRCLHFGHDSSECKGEDKSTCPYRHRQVLPVLAFRS
ncbi:hypothetical protein QE152_g35165 [Popillia japonica]|uniref:CCHC-type domain-containing protein n=1 Tax=Popillia japonica TaxID=7064 RepID=A0AAW1IRQ9_POPJA